MRILLTLFLLIAVNSLAQEPTNDLYDHVNNLMKEELDFACDKSCVRQETEITKADKNSEKQRKGVVCHTPSSPKNYHPLIILDGSIAQTQQLKNYSLADVNSIEILKDTKATAIYGTNGSKGVVVIDLK